MGTTAEKLRRLLETKEGIRVAIEEKGQTVADTDPFSVYPDKIRAIESREAPQPLDAKKVYAALRSNAWPPMPEDVPEHTIVFLYTGAGIAAFTVACEGQYTVEIKLCTNSGGEWSYQVESAETLDSGASYSKVFEKAELPEYRLMTVSASSITGFTLLASEGGINMRGCVEILCRLPGMRTPILKNMKELEYVTELGQAGGTNSSSSFMGCESLICVIGPELSLKGSLSNCFHGCKNLLALDISVDQSKSSILTSCFDGCEKIAMIPKEFTANFAGSMNAFIDCLSLKEISLNKKSAGTAAFSLAFKYCISLESITFEGGVATVSFGNAFSGCISLKRLLFNVKGITGNLSIANCAFQRQGLVELFESLPVYSGTGDKTLTITGNPGVADLTEEDKAIATAKNWTLII